jgi:hypothetical protein
MTEQASLTLPLHAIAHARAGDKGNRSNISVIAYNPELYDVIVDQVTSERVGDLFRHRGPVEVTRYELPRLWAVNFVIDNALEGGVNRSLNLDAHGKSLSFLVLSLTVNVPAHLASLFISPSRGTT